jgi:hypothetical protein
MKCKKHPEQELLIREVKICKKCDVERANKYKKRMRSINKLKALKLWEIELE